MASVPHMAGSGIGEDGHDDIFMLTPATTVADPKDLFDRPTKSQPSIPCPGKTFIIRDIKSGEVLTLFDGKVCLLPEDQLGSAIHWSCHEKDGWLGFKNLASGQYLGFHERGHLRTMPHHQDWEYICLRMVPGGGYVMLMQHERGRKIWPVKVKMDQGVRQLAKVNVQVDQGLTWEFIEA